MGRAPCCDKNGLKKGPWTPEEDQKLIDYIQKHGHSSWRTLPKNAGLQRCGKSCRLRWTNYLRPDIKRGRFSFDEEETIIQLHSVLGNKWSAIAARLPGRTDNEIKNYWNTHIRKRLLRMGIDPVTHSPRVDLLDLSSLFTSQLHNSPQLMLGIQPLINPELIRLATSLLSSQPESTSLLLQNLREYQLRNQQSQCQNQFQSFQANQLQSSVVPYHKFLNKAPLLQSLNNVNHQTQSNPSYFACQDSQLNVWQDNAPASNITTHLASVPNYGYHDSNHLCIDNTLSESSVLQSFNTANQNLNFDSVLSTPSSGLNPLTSCSTYTSTTDDERDSHYGIPDILDINEFM